jgi:hypothetical protein
VSAARGEIIAFLDADLSSDISHLSELLALLDHADIALGSRAADGAIVRGRTTARQVGSNAYRMLTQAMTAGTITDTQCGFKAFRAPVAKLLFSMTSATGFGFDVEILTLATALDFTIAEYPIRWTATEGGHVMLRRHGLGMLQDLRRARRHRQRARAECWNIATHADPWTPQAVSRPAAPAPAVAALDAYLSAIPPGSAARPLRPGLFD